MGVGASGRQGRRAQSLLRGGGRLRGDPGEGAQSRSQLRVTTKAVLTESRGVHCWAPA